MRFKLEELLVAFSKMGFRNVLVIFKIAILRKMGGELASLVKEHGYDLTGIESV